MAYKVIYVGGFSSDERGAIGTHTAGILRALDEIPDVQVIGIFYSFSLPFYLPAKSLLFDSRRPNSAIGKIINIVNFATFVNRVIKDEMPDLIYSRFDPFSSIFFRNKRCSKFVIEYNDVFADQIQIRLQRGDWGFVGKMVRSSITYRLFLRYSEAKTFRRSDVVACVTEGLAQYCSSVSPSTKCVVILNASNAKPSSAFNPLPPCDTNQLVISHVGTLTYWDGLEELLDALVLAKSKNKDFRFILNIVGSGSLQAVLEDKVRNLGLSEYTVFTPPVPHREALKVLEQTDVVPLLKTISSYGLSPIKFYESLAMGCFVIASNIRHINEAPNYAVKTVSIPLDTNEIADAFITAYERRDQIRLSKQQIKNYAFRYHTWDARVTQLLEVLRD